MDDSLDSWFAREILSHEEVLVRYLTRSWPNRDEVHDLRQDTYIRLYESAVKARPLAPKAFLFTTARNLMADRLRRRRIVSIEATGDVEALNVSVDEISPERITSAHQELRRLAQAFDLLPAKCRDVMWMRKVEDLPQKEVALRMGISEGAVEKHITKGVRMLARFLFGGERADAIKNDAGNFDVRVEHGKQHTD